MNRNYFLIIVIVSLLCLVLIFLSLGKEIDTPITKEPSFIPPRAPFKSYISGTGLVEPSSENIYINTSLNRVVEKVMVNVGEKVKKGDILIRLENRDLEADLLAKEIALKSAQAKLERLEAFPRMEDLLAASATLDAAKSEFELAKKQYEMVQQLSDPKAISQDERNRRLFTYQQSEAKLEQAKVDLEKIKAGTWKPDLEIARLEVLQSKAEVNRIRIEIERTIIRSPIDGTVLQIRTHEGEFPSLDSSKGPMMILGNTDEMYLRVSINQLDIPYFHASAQAVAFLQGDSRIEFPLDFVRVDPFLVNKQALTNEITERVDTRVLQIIYRIKKDLDHIFVGQQMDVFIKDNLSHGTESHDHAQ